MAFTSHGHQILGTLALPDQPKRVARCGGPRLCKTCRNDAMGYHEMNNNTESKELMDNQTKARTLVAQYFNRKAEKTDHFQIDLDDVYVVWFTYILGNWKALVSTTVNDGMYYEVTYDKAKSSTYLDAYKKFDNVEIPDGEFNE